MILTIRNYIVKVEMELSFFEKQQKKDACQPIS